MVRKRKRVQASGAEAAPRTGKRARRMTNSRETRACAVVYGPR